MYYLFEPLTPDSIYDAAAFVQKHEYCCVNLAQQLRLCLYPACTARYKKAALLYACPNQRRQYKTCCGILLFSTNGTLLHCIGTDVPQTVRRAFGTYFFAADFPYPKLHAIIGSREYTLVLEQLITQAADTNRTAAAEAALDAAVDYYLMRHTGTCGKKFREDAEQKLGIALSITRAGEADIEELFPLQRDYDMSEVAYEGHSIEPSVSRLLLRSRLRSEYIYAVSAQGHILAKAGTNAQGMHWFQIGGVYTLPEYRNKGLAAAAVAHLINAHSAEAHGFTLFVKTENAAAIKVYTNLGFEQCGMFRMSYWKSID